MIFFGLLALAERDQNWVDPSERAMNLLFSWLSPQQRKDYLRHDWFLVTGSSSGKTYRINKAVAPYNVEELNPDGTTKRRLCFVPKGTAYTGDIMLAQKIGLEKNEVQVLSVANDYNRWQYMPGLVHTPNLDESA